MGEAYGVFALATGLFGLIAWLAYRHEKSGRRRVDAILAAAIVGILMMAVYTWIGWDAHSQCKGDPGYARLHPDYC